MNEVCSLLTNTNMVYTVYRAYKLQRKWCRTPNGLFVASPSVAGWWSRVSEGGSSCNKWLLGSSAPRTRCVSSSPSWLREERLRPHGPGQYKSTTVLMSRKMFGPLQESISGSTALTLRAYPPTNGREQSENKKVRDLDLSGLRGDLRYWTLWAVIDFTRWQVK